MLAVLIYIKMERSLAGKQLTYISPTFFLIFSWAFCDYMTSGLENPLSYLLVSILLMLLFQENFQQHLRTIFGVLALLVLNRLDYGLLFLPLAIILMISCRSMTGVMRVIWPGTLLILLWLAFSTIYFGTPFSNTFYAKLNADYPKVEVLQKGG